MSLRRFESPARCLLSITGFILIYYPFGSGVLNALVPAALSYVAMLRFREHAATLTWLTSFGYLLW